LTIKAIRFTKGDLIEGDLDVGAPTEGGVRLPSRGGRKGLEEKDAVSQGGVWGSFTDKGGLPAPGGGEVFYN